MLSALFTKADAVIRLSHYSLRSSPVETSHQFSRKWREIRPETLCRWLKSFVNLNTEEFNLFNFCTERLLMELIAFITDFKLRCWRIDGVRRESSGRSLHVNFDETWRYVPITLIGFLFCSQKILRLSRWLSKKWLVVTIIISENKYYAKLMSLIFSIFFLFIF